MSQQFEDIYGYVHNIKSEISRGGQGAVFRTQNPNIAVKIVFDSTGTEFCKDITQNESIDKLRLLPIPKNTNLTMPQATLKDYAGYVMTLLDDMESFEKAFDFSFDNECEYANEWLEQFKEEQPDFVNVFGQYISSGGRRRRLTAYFHAACILAKLHSNGLVYCDFSAKNAFISETISNNIVWLIDADNLDYQENTRYTGYYTPGYGAPEVINGKGCTFYSDSYAFAVSLYWQLTGTHPFRGALMDGDFSDDFTDDKEEKANMGEFPWIMDQDDNSNYVDAQIQQELVVSERMNKYFDRMFSESGKKKRNTRPTIFELSNALAVELDHSIKCKFCQMDYDSSFDICPWCDTDNKRIVIKSKVDDRIIWEFEHELFENINFSVPLRVLNGLRNAEIDDSAFFVNSQKNETILNELYDRGEWYISVDGITFKEVFGNLRIEKDCCLKFISRDTEETVIIEVKVK